jgi:hypothetical protein
MIFVIERVGVFSAFFVVREEDAGQDVKWMRGEGAPCGTTDRTAVPQDCQGM